MAQSLFCYLANILCDLYQKTDENLENYINEKYESRNWPWHMCGQLCFWAPAVNPEGKFDNRSTNRDWIQPCQLRCTHLWLALLLPESTPEALQGNGAVEAVTIF